MKKNYIKPTAKAINLQTESLICGSPDASQEVRLGLDLDNIEDEGYAD